MLSKMFDGFDRSHVRQNVGGLGHSPRSGERGYCGSAVDRRGFLRMGSLAGLSLADVLRLQHASGADATPKKDVNCIFIFIIGGMAHQDLWDPKPDAPSEMRGEFSAIKTVVPGIQLTSLLPNVAQVTDKFAILRSMTHSDPDHVAGYHVMMTGVHPGTGPAFNRTTTNNNVHPSLGSTVAKLGRNDSSLPPYISIPDRKSVV